MSLREHEQNAARCLALAEQLSDVALKQSMIGMAAAWLRLAEQAEKNLALDVVYEPPPAKAGPTRYAAIAADSA